MNPFFVQVVWAVIRWAMGIGLGYAVRAGLLADADAIKYATAAAAALTPLVWSVWQKYTSQHKLVTALASSGAMSETQLEAKMANPAIASPSVLSAKDEIPKP